MRKLYGEDARGTPFEGDDRRNQTTVLRRLSQTKQVLVQRQKAPELGPGAHALVETAEPEELVGRVKLLVGGREREKKRLQAQNLLEERRGGQCATDPHEQRLLVRIHRAQRARCGPDRRVVGRDRVGGDSSRCGL